MNLKFHFKVESSMEAEFL